MEIRLARRKRAVASWLFMRESGHRQAGDAAHLAPQLRDAPAGQRRGHPSGAGTARARARGDDDDLHARRQGAARAAEEPAGSAGVKGAQNNQHRTPNAEYRTPNIERRTSNAEHRTSNAERRTPNVEVIGKRSARGSGSKREGNFFILQIEIAIGIGIKTR